MTEQPTQPAGPGAGQQSGEGTGDALEQLHDALGTEEPEGGDGTGGEQEWQPPTREEYDALVKAREAAEGKLKRARTQAQRLREGKGTAGAAASGAAGEEGAPAGPDPETEKWKGVAVRQAAKSALLARGADADMVELAVTRLNLAGVEVDPDGEPELEDWLDEMEERYPKLFAKAPAPGAPGRVPGRLDQGAAAAGRPVQRKLSFGEQVIANSETARIQASRRPRG